MALALLPIYLEKKLIKTAITVRKEPSHKRLPIRTALHVEVYLAGKGKRSIGSIYLSLTDHVREEYRRDLLNHLPSPIMLMEYFNADNPLWGSKNTSTRGKMLKKILKTKSSEKPGRKHGKIL